MNIDTRPDKLCHPSVISLRRVQLQYLMRLARHQIDIIIYCSTFSVVLITNITVYFDRYRLIILCTTWPSLLRIRLRWHTNTYWTWLLPREEVFGLVQYCVVVMKCCYSLFYKNSFNTFITMKVKRKVWKYQRGNQKS